MALTKNKTYVKITVDGRPFGYSVTPGEVDLWVKAEKLINDEINTFRKNHKKESNESDINYRADSIIVVLIKTVMELLRKESESEETLYALREMNSQLDSYIKKN
ncbi:MAG: hypothetical protein LKM37_07720 [Bacteroidales bacterium]|jgi:hypothetical protein|nr:hypothetical protein [Bacteroidales bacterium]